MTTTLIILLVVTSIAKLITAPPNIVVVWLTKRYAMHQKLVAQEASITFNGTELSPEKKEAFATYFSEANFLEKYYIFPGNEENFLHPETDNTPFVIKTKQGKKDITMYVYKEENHIDVVKQAKKKVISYSLLAPKLNEFSVTQ
ncbi:MAG: hypothetical protein KBT36_06225 [Kurthia sp.]|nr:hypothetical protein [Candidatus Kurthia equi]